MVESDLVFKAPIHLWRQKLGKYYYQRFYLNVPSYFYHRYPQALHVEIAKHKFPIKLWRCGHGRKRAFVFLPDDIIRDLNLREGDIIECRIIC